VQRRLPLWIGGAGEKRTLRTAARFADGWNAPYLAPGEWKRKNEVLDRWCAELGRDGRTIARTINVGFYMGADARGAAAGEERFAREWSADTRGFTGFLRGTPVRAAEVARAYREVGVERLNIAVRGGPYDWDALAAFAEEVIPAVR
jgi:alkanesulfonate monooxygenase SsuD/methylene tetrahydromethanopterin reductase-like flavin-dependent oxidoreductase (luciferase family)